MSTTVLLGARGKVPFIGEEKGVAKPSGISIFKSPHGSVRFLLSQEGVPLSALQIVHAKGRSPVVANVFTDPDARGQGYAKLLFEAAKLAYPGLRHASPYNRTDEGDAWVRALERGGKGR